MEYGNAAWGLRETPLPRQLEITRAMGLKLLELSIAGYDKDYLQLDATPEQIRQAKAWFEAAGIRPDCGSTGNDFTGDDAKEQLVKVKKVIDIAAAVGVKLLRIFAGFNSDSVVFGARLETMLDCLREAACYAASKGVTLAVETHGGVAANGNALVHFHSTSTRVDTLDAIVKTGVSLNYDPANLAAAGAVDPVAYFDRYEKYIKYVHLKDFRDVPGGVVPAACGEGRLDWPKLTAALRRYRGPALIEYELPADIEDGLRRSLAYLNAHEGK